VYGLTRFISHLEQNDDMRNIKFVFGAALLVPLLAPVLPAEAAKVDSTAARAACFKQANAAAAAAGGASNTQLSERQAYGYDAYVSCCKKAGIRP